ncbi:MAG: 23S rRNA (adenine(2503)-C(2))-methyltransferase RlmN [Bdellovibrionales bacterium]|nr:23S rRNA (adenine(2503)-C(2))-methyltransferase RlmN [Bdellovibrionales bacterium]
MDLAGKTHFYSLTLNKLQELMMGSGKERFRAQQLFKWVYEKDLTDFEQMTNLSKDLRLQLEGQISFALPEMVDRRISTDGTRKYLFDIGQCQTVEAVLIPSDDRKTLCLSSEVGCNMACQFCFTGKQKLKRRLTAGEIVGQYLQVKKDLDPERITNIVFMGMGEPLDNCEAVFDAIDIFKNDFGLNIGRKKITVSTSGLVPQIPLVTASGSRLAVSLNAPNDEIRNRIMPINKKYPLKDLMAACKEYTEKAKDRVTFEYVLLKDCTDDIEHAKQVAKLVRDIPCKINLIPFNEHPDSGFERPHKSKVFQFQRYLLDKGFHVTIRKTMGRDIFAACGQLTSLYKGHPQKQDVLTGTLG